MDKGKFGSLHVDVEPFLGKLDFTQATDEEKTSHEIKRKSVSYWGDAWRKLKSNKVAMVSLIIIICMLLFAWVGPFFVEYTYDQQIIGSENMFPLTYSETEQGIIDGGGEVYPHVFGTDALGHDIFVRVMYGIRVSMSIGVVAALLVLLIGSVYGSISGYFGGMVDAVMMRISEIIYSVPDVLIVLLLAITMKPSIIAFARRNSGNIVGQAVSSLGPSIIAILIAFALLYWVSMARIIRGEVMQIKQQEFVLAARSMGASGRRIITHHLLPNTIGSMIAATCLQIPSAIFLESFLSFLGLGVEAPMTSLGALASDGLGGMYTYTYKLIIPSVVLSVMILAFNLFGDGLRDALDPRIKG